MYRYNDFDEAFTRARVAQFGQQVARRHWNRLMDAMIQDEVIQQMFLRRLRTAMDELFGPPGTTDSYIDRRLDQFLASKRSASATSAACS